MREIEKKELVLNAIGVSTKKKAKMRVKYGMRIESALAIPIDKKWEEEKKKTNDDSEENKKNSFNDFSPWQKKKCKNKIEDRSGTQWEKGANWKRSMRFIRNRLLRHQLKNCYYWHERNILSWNNGRMISIGLKEGCVKESFFVLFYLLSVTFF